MAYVTDWRGKVRVIRQNGVKVGLVEKPSQEYLDWLKTVKSPPQYVYTLTSETKIAPGLSTVTLNSKTFRFPRELTTSEEARLEAVTKMKIKAKRVR